MNKTLENLSNLDWEKHLQALNENGYVQIPEVLSDEICKDLIANYEEKSVYRSVIDMKRYQFGQGEYKYFQYPLPKIVTNLRTNIYPHLAKVANDWMLKLGMNQVYPEKHSELLDFCHQNEQKRPTPLILKYKKNDWNALHQDLYGEIFFPFQVVFFLTQPNEDYTGGEFLMVENRPRMQSKGIVLQPNRGEAVIFTTNFRPVLGGRGFYRTSMRHGVSEIRSGERYNLGIIFHDAK